MSRWMFLAAFGWASGMLACSSSLQQSPLQVGLFNAPPLGGTRAAESRVRDVLSNGQDSCGRFTEQSPLRIRVPPCPTMTQSVGASPTTELPRTPSLVEPWVDHFYYGWPCRRAPSSTDSRTASWVTMESVDSAPECTVPEN